MKIKWWLEMGDPELDSLREKRRRELIAQSLKKELAQKKQEMALAKARERQIRATKIVSTVLEPEAVVYLNWLSQSNPPVAQTIKDSIIMLIYKKMIDRKLTKIDLMRIERELTGKEPNIKVKRRGQEVASLDEALKGKDER